MPRLLCYIHAMLLSRRRRRFPLSSVQQYKLTASNFMQFIQKNGRTLKSYENIAKRGEIATFHAKTAERVKKLQIIQCGIRAYSHKNNGLHKGSPQFAHTGYAYIHTIYSSGLLHNI